ncbi:MAG: SsrA-binding protein SmpB [Candidatus Doudnabacteria bacterium]
MKSLALNKRAKFDYSITETFDAGLMLTGAETKSAKNGGVHLTNSYIKINAEGAYLVDTHIAPYKYSGDQDYNPTASRKLLLTKAELNKLSQLTKGTVIVPLEIFINPKGLIKVKVGLGQGRKKYDKREYIKQRDAKKEIRSHLDR